MLKDSEVVAKFDTDKDFRTAKLYLVQKGVPVGAIKQNSLSNEIHVKVGNAENAEEVKDWLISKGGKIVSNKYSGGKKRR